MKKINIIVILTGFITFSCSDFLQEVPRDELSTDQFFTVPLQAQNAVNSLYRNGAPQMYTSAGVYSGSRAMLGEYMSGFFDNEYKGQEFQIQYAQQLTMDGDNTATYLGGIWNDLYRGISRANNAILNIPDTPGLSEEDIKRLSAEAKFFRAFAYYHLVRMFGAVPIITEPYETLDDLYVANSPVQDVYNLIVEDLQYAADENNGLANVSMADNGYRVTRTVANTLLSEAYLTMSGYPLQQDNYGNAATAARAVINSNVYSLTQHGKDAAGNVVPENSAYNQIRQADVLANEYIYSIEYTVGIENSPYPPFCYPVALAGDVAYALTNGAYQPVNSFLQGYDAVNDLRRQEKQYFHSSLTVDDSIRNFATSPYMWHDDQALFETATSGKDLLVYSYADALLIAAEAIANSEGVTAEAVGYLTQVRSRAYWQQTPEAISAQLSALSPEAFVQEVWKERYRELVFEFQLWPDIQRTRMFPQTSANGDITYVNVVGQTNNWGKTFAEKNLLFPIPETERQRNPNLTQNEGY